MRFLDADGVNRLCSDLRSRFAEIVHTHAISDVTGLQTALNGKQATLVSGTNIKTVNGTSLLGSGNISTAELPTVTTSDNGKVLQVVSGAWAAASLPSANGVSF